MQGRPHFPQQIPIQSDGQWPQTASFEQPSQGLLYMDGEAPGQAYLPPNLQSASQFPHQGIQAPNGANSSYAAPQGASQNLPHQLSYMPHLVPNALHQPNQNPVQDPLHNPAHNPLLQPVQNPLLQPVQNSVLNPLHNPVQNPPHNPVQVPLHNPVQNPLHSSAHNPLHQPAQNPVLNPLHNPVQNSVPNPVPNPVHNAYLNQQLPNAFHLTVNQVSDFYQTALSQHLARPGGLASDPPMLTSSYGLTSGKGGQPAIQGQTLPGYTKGPFRTRSQWDQNAPPGMQTAPTGRGPPQNETRGAPMQAVVGNQGPPSFTQTRNPTPSHNQHRSPGPNHARPIPNHDHPVPSHQPNGRYSTKPPSIPLKSETRTKLAKTQQLESGENLGQHERGLKRPAESQGGDWKRQRNEGVRVPGWKGKETEAVDVSDQFALEDVNKDVFKKEVEKETDAHRLKQRQKQIDFGKNTLGYERYLEQVPRFRRQKGDPQTPKISQVCSKRSWDGQIKKWRRLLHKYDPPVDDEAEFAEEEYLPGYRGNTTGGNDEDAATEPHAAEEEETVTVEASVFEEDEDEFVGL